MCDIFNCITQILCDPIDRIGADSLGFGRGCLFWHKILYHIWKDNSSGIFCPNAVLKHHVDSDRIRVYETTPGGWNTSEASASQRPSANRSARPSAIPQLSGYVKENKQVSSDRGRSTDVTIRRKQWQNSEKSQRITLLTRFISDLRPGRSLS